MKKLNKTFLVLTTALFVWIGLTTTAFGQATSIIREEFDKEIKKAYETTTATFPRRETYSNPTEMEVRVAGEKESSYSVLSKVAIEEFSAKDKIRYEFIQTSTRSTFVTKRIQIGSICYDLDGKEWNTTEKSCDPQAGFGTASGVSAKHEYFVENSTIGSKPVKIFRNIDTGKVYSNGAPPYIDERVYYIDSAGRLLKEEHLTRRGEGKSTLNNSTKYEYDLTIETIVAPSARKKIKKRR